MVLKMAIKVHVNQQHHSTQGPLPGKKYIVVESKSKTLTKIRDNYEKMRKEDY